MTKKSLASVLLLALILVSVKSFDIQEIAELIKQGYEIKERFEGWKEAILETEELIESIYYGDEIDMATIVNNPDLHDKYKEIVEEEQKQGYNYSILNCSVGSQSQYWKFAAFPVGRLGFNVKSTQTITLQTLPSDCWDKVTVTFTVTGPTSYEIYLNPTGPTHQKCAQIYTLATPQKINLPITLRKARKIVAKHAKPEQMQAIHNFGMYVYRTCDSADQIANDMLMTLALFIGGFGTDPWVPIFGSHPAPWQQTMNPQFIYQGNNYQWRPRKNVLVDLNASQVHSGDFLIITRMDGLDQIIQWGAGSIAGHSVTLLEMDGEMYAIESQAGWYWPQSGIQKTPWSQWKVWARNAGFNVALLPLSDEARAKFNVTAAQEFFKSVEGYPYGYHNFIFGWLDKPSENIPPVTDMSFLFVLFSQLERIYPEPVVSIMGEALNKRLGTTNLTLFQISMEIYQRNMTLDQLFAIPEMDGWIYSDGPSYVCSAFVAGVYKAAGLFEGFTVQATEFTPRDVYQMMFFNTSGIRPQECINADPDLPYCQIMGKYKMDITNDGWNTRMPYENMYQTCPSMPPYYNRPVDC